LSPPGDGAVAALRIVLSVVPDAPPDVRLQRNVLFGRPKALGSRRPPVSIRC
jgi:hypothetical protein